MFVLDTNVVSELMLPDPELSVCNWINSQEQENLYLSSVSESELHFGLALMSAGKRRDRLVERVAEMLREDFANRILPFASSAAREYAKVAIARRVSGHSLDIADLQIAAIARVHSMAVVTRNLRDFTDTGVEIINPWQGS